MIQIVEFACYLILINFKNCSNYFFSFSFHFFSSLFFARFNSKATGIGFSTLKDFDLKHRIIVTIFGEVCAKECLSLCLRAALAACITRKKSQIKEELRLFCLYSPAKRGKAQTFFSNQNMILSQFLLFNEANFFLEHNEHQHEHTAETWFCSHINWPFSFARISFPSPLKFLTATLYAFNSSKNL